ncbi:MAG: hypothetical protein CBB92_03365 [Flammeovirgaceae bacterium TMED32]|nr:MAG: hypothetical protein CBB92_03365 [Flammeovirgaceae bacterium TMED32]|tara:strand:+ start:50 stop:349 length:300 start_codon:yes stop_codon:yes gene_type:complete
MPFQKGNKYGKTTKRGEGKITSEIRERLKGLLVDTLQSVKLEELSKAEKLRLIEISLRYTLPKRIIEEPVTNDFKVEIVQSIDQYSDKELEDILKERCS